MQAKPLTLRQKVRPINRGHAPVEGYRPQDVGDAMQRFKIGDRILLIPRFAHLYPSGSAVVVEVTLDPFRPMFNEYKIEFRDGSIASVFEFQIQVAEE